MALIVPIIMRERRNRARIVRRYLRDTMNPFEIHEHLFIRQYRLPPRLTFDLIDEIRPFTDNIGDIPLEIQVLCVLNFYASGSYQLRVGSDGLACVSQPMISRYIEKYSGIIAGELSQKYVRFPRSQNEMALKKRIFQDTYAFPGIIGVIDGTHVNLSAVLHRIEIAYVNRKMQHSINVQIVCDANLVILSVNARYPGSFHDAFIYGASQLKTFLENNYALHPNVWTWLLGDSAYPLVPWLMVPIRANRENLNNRQRMFNVLHRRVRNLIERCIGVLKLRFRCILGERQLRYHPTKAAQIFYACAVLHNFLIFNRFDILRDIDENNLLNQIEFEREVNDALNVLPEAGEIRQEGVLLRDQLIEYLFV